MLSSGVSLSKPYSGSSFFLLSAADAILSAIYVIYAGESSGIFAFLRYEP